MYSKTMAICTGTSGGMTSAVQPRDILHAPSHAQSLILCQHASCKASAHATRCSLQRLSACWNPEGLPIGDLWSVRPQMCLMQ